MRLGKGATYDARQQLYKMANNDLSGLFSKYRNRLQKILKILISYNDLNYKRDNYSWLSEKEISLAEQWLSRQDDDTKSEMSTLSALANLRKAKSEIYKQDNIDKQYFNAMKDAYRLMNEIGEEIRGKKIVYSVVIGSEYKNNIATQKEQWDGLNIEEFLDLSSMSQITKDAARQGRYGRTLRLSSDSVVLSKLRNRQQGYHKWTANEIRQFNIYETLARSKSMGQSKKDPTKARWQDVNMGNITEGYLRLQKYNLKSVFESMRRTMERPAPFWQGGDLEESFDKIGIQIKTNGASITNIGSMISQLVKLDNQILKIEQIMSDPVKQEEYMQQSGISTSMEEMFKKEVDSLVMNFLQGTVEEKNAYMSTTYGGDSSWQYG